MFTRDPMLDGAAEFMDGADVDEDQDRGLVDALKNDSDAALGEAVDLAAVVKQDLLKDIPGGLFAFMGQMRAAAIDSCKDLISIDPTDAAGVRKIQMDMLIYARTVAFAQQAVTGYMDHEDRSGSESNPVD